MANLFLDLPLAGGQGPGPAVDVSAMGATKTIVATAIARGSIAIEISVDGGNTWGPIATFQRRDKQVIDVAAQFMRTVKSSAAASGSVTVAANDDGAMFALLPLPAGVGAGPAVDVSLLGNFTTFVFDGVVFDGSVTAQVSDDLISWGPCFSFTTGNHVKSKDVAGRWMRAFVTRRSTGGAFSGSLAVGAINDAVSFVPPFDDPITVRGGVNAEGVSQNIVRADHQHRLELEVLDEGVLEGARPTVNFVGAGVGAVDNPGLDRVDVTIPGGLADGAVVERDFHVEVPAATSSIVFVDGLAGGSVVVPIAGNYWAIFEGECFNQSASGILEIGISVNSIAAVVATSERESQGNASDMRPCVTTVPLPGLAGGDLVRALFRKVSGAGSVSLGRRRLTIIKVQ